MRPAEVADRTGTHERFVTEWLLGQAAAGLLDRTVPDGGTEDDALFEALSDAGAAVLADEEASLSFSAGAFRGGIAPDTVDAIADSFRTGIGITYEQQGPTAAAGLARMTGPWSRLALTDIVLPALDGVVDKLTAGATAVDVGCGAGYMLCELASSFPASHCVGIDLSETAIGMARACGRARPHERRVRRRRRRRPLPRHRGRRRADLRLPARHGPSRQDRRGDRRRR